MNAPQSLDPRTLLNLGVVRPASGFRYIRSGTTSVKKGRLLAEATKSVSSRRPYKEFRYRGLSCGSCLTVFEQSRASFVWCVPRGI